MWWGHRIPVWYIVGKDSEEEYIVARNTEEALDIAQKKYGKDAEIYQDPDVLDTWFSRFADGALLRVCFEIDYHDANKLHFFCCFSNVHANTR